MPRTAAPRTHVFLTVPVAEGTFAVDPGFGGLAPRFPVPLVVDESAQIEGEKHWMVREYRLWVLRAQVGDGAVDAWVSTLEEEILVDFDMGNYFTSTHPDSPFVNRVMMSTLTDDGRITVMNRDLTIRRGTQIETTQLADRKALRAQLAEHFAIDLPDVEQMRVSSIPEWA